MPKNTPISPDEFISSFKGFLDQVATQAPPEDPIFLQYLRTHFASDLLKLPIVGEKFEKSEHPNLHLAIETFLAKEGCSARLLGINAPHEHMGIRLGNLMAPHRGGLSGYSGPTEGPVEYVNIALHDNRVLACVRSGLYLVEDGSEKLAVLVSGPHDMYPRQSLDIEVMATDRAAAEHFLATIRTAMRKKNVYRGHVISLRMDRRFGVPEASIHFHRLPQVAHDKIILPSGLLERIERHTVEFAHFSKKLRGAQRHLKRGILLHGQPGTGKTLSAMYLAGKMPDRTVILLTGMGVGMIEKSCQMARLLQPSTVILEDVDLIAEERTQQDPCSNTLLFELLNQMDGLSDDADILFLLTTNRPDLLEPALASRPGRIDQAIEVPLPDGNCRRRLFDLYGQGMQLNLKTLDTLIERTEGVSPAFIREFDAKSGPVFGR